MDINIRSLIPEDYDAVISIWSDADLEFRPNGRDNPEALKHFIEDNQDLCLCAEYNGKLIGVIFGSDDGRKAWINRVAVHPEYQRKGVGANLITALEAAFKKRGREVFSALIYDVNTASKMLFQKAGFSNWAEVQYFSKRNSKDS